jgi:hypothetical protein
MKRTIFFLLLIVLLSSGSGRANVQPGTLYAGVELGSLTGLDCKVWINKADALEFSLGTTAPNALAGQATYLWHLFNVFHGQGEELARSLPLYFGLGGQFAGASEWPYGHAPAEAGLRTVCGAVYMFPRQPFDVFLEVAPTFYVTPDVVAAVHAETGLRFRF